MRNVFIAIVVLGIAITAEAAGPRSGGHSSGFNFTGGRSYVASGGHGGYTGGHAVGRGGGFGFRPSYSSPRYGTYGPGYVAYRPTYYYPGYYGAGYYQPYYYGYEPEYVYEPGYYPAPVVVAPPPAYYYAAPRYYSQPVYVRPRHYGFSFGFGFRRY